MLHAVPVSEPLYEQVYRILKSRIVEGALQPNSLLPGEVQLSQEMGVSVGTIRKAMDQLAREKLVFRERGRGTFVKLDDGWQFASGFQLIDFVGGRIVPSIEYTGVSVTDPPSDELQGFGAAFGKNGKVIRISRIWNVRDALVNEENITLDAARFPDLLRVQDKSATEFGMAYGLAVKSKIARFVWQIYRPQEGAAENKKPRGGAGEPLRLVRLGYDAKCRLSLRIEHKVNACQLMLQIDP